MQLDAAKCCCRPQCQPQTIAHLCQRCGISVLFYDESYETLAGQAAEKYRAIAGSEDAILRTVPTSSKIRGLRTLEIISSTTITPPARKPYWPVSKGDIDVLRHSSGTSGNPKPIQQTHHQAIGVLPCLSNGRRSASFTTTPLYHGGMADVMRAWTSDALIWIFPGKDVPITPANIIKSIEVAQKAVKDQQYRGFPQIKYFSSVPYVLQMLAGDAQGLGILKAMDIVGVGGAALPSFVGNDLVAKGVNLISRFGSAECGCRSDRITSWPLLTL